MKSESGDSDLFAYILKAKKHIQICAERNIVERHDVSLRLNDVDLRSNDVVSAKCADTNTKRKAPHK